MKGWVKEGQDDKGGRDTSNEKVEKITMVNAAVVDSSLARQIMVRAQIIDIDKSALKDFGVDWGRVVTTLENGVEKVHIEDQPFLIGQSPQGPMDLFGGGSIQRFDPIGARVRALEQQNKAKVLSQPNLLVLDGDEGNILVGGEIPVPIVQSAGVGTAASVSVVFKEFGVRLKVNPTITGTDTMQLHVMPEVSALDFANAVQFSGFVIPALRTRRAETVVNVKNGQSLLIGGLLSNDTSKLIKKIPVLGDIPILGELFKTRSFVNNETELVIIITPQITSPTATQASAK
jgi:pilus assembly protein CpaC